MSRFRASAHKKPQKDLGSQVGDAGPWQDPGSRERDIGTGTTHCLTEQREGYVGNGACLQKGPSDGNDILSH